MKKNIICIKKAGESYQIQGNMHFNRSFDNTGTSSSPDFSLSCGWDCTGSGELTAYSDRLGFIPLFYSCNNDSIVLSDNAAAVVSECKVAELDHDALSVFFRLGFFLGNDTPFKEIKVIPPGSRLFWNGSLSSMVDSLPDFKSATYSRNEAVEQYDHLFDASMRSRTNDIGNISLPLSGGRDSRHILLQLVKLGHKPIEALTINNIPSGDQEIQCAKKMAELCGIPHKIINAEPRTQVTRELIKNRYTHCLTDEHAWSLDLPSYMDKRATVIFDGIGGDILSNGLFFDDRLVQSIARGDAEGAADQIVAKHYGKKSDIKFVDKTLTKKLSHQVAIEHIAQEISRHVNTPNPVKSFYFWNRTRREIALSPFCMLGRNHQVSTPYLDKDLLAFLFSLPYEDFGRPGFHDEVINHAFPQQQCPYAASTKRKLTIQESIGLRFGLLAFAARNPFIKNIDPLFTWPRLIRAILTNPNKEKCWTTFMIYMHSVNNIMNVTSDEPGQTYIRN